MRSTELRPKYNLLFYRRCKRDKTIGKETYKLEEPFLVLATQNPIEQEGTYPLPEAQIDRFMLKVNIGYPTKDEEKLIMRKNILGEITQKINAAVTPATIIKARESVRSIYMDDKIENYILDIVFSSRSPSQYGLSSIAPLISYGGSPRATINLALAAKAYAFIQRRAYVIQEDVRNICKDVMRHRIGITYEAEAENITKDDIITQILNTVQVP